MAKSKSKGKEEVKAVLPKNPNEFTYRGDELLEIKASDFLALAKVVEIAISNGVIRSYPTREKFVQTATGLDAKSPTRDEIQGGLVRPIMDVDATFNQDNIKQDYAEWLVPDVVNAKSIIFKTHAENVKLGNAVPIAEVQAEDRARREEAAKRPRLENVEAVEAGNLVVDAPAAKKASPEDVVGETTEGPAPAAGTGDETPEEK